MAKWLLVDGFNLAFRSFYGMPDLTRSDGFPTNAIHGWIRTLWYLEDQQKPDHVVVFFDKGSSDREKILPSYKENRAETPEALAQQIPWLKKITAAMGYGSIEQDGKEADDLIAAFALNLIKGSHDAWIVSSDKDLAQIIQPGIFQLLPPPTANPKLGWRLLDVPGVEKKFNVKPSQIVDYLSLIGDSSDNIPGLQGVGPKTAVKWINEYGSLDTIIEKANYIAPARFQSLIAKHAEDLRINQKLISLQTDLELPPITPASPNLPELTQILTEMEMKKALSDSQKRYGEKSGVADGI